MRWLWLDEIVEIEKGVKAFTRSRVPQSGITRELLLIEMMAQTGGLLVGAMHNFEQDVVFSKIEHAQFEKGLKEGELLEIEAVSDQLRPEGAWIDAAIRCMNRLVARARLLLANVGHLVPEHNQSVTFHPEFMRYFKVRNKVR